MSGTPGDEFADQGAVDVLGWRGLSGAAGTIGLQLSEATIQMWSTQVSPSSWFANTGGVVGRIRAMRGMPVGLTGTDVAIKRSVQRLSSQGDS